MNKIGNRSAAILIGGKAVRMSGISKFSLKNADGISYLQLQMDVLHSFDRIYLSAADKGQLLQASKLLTVGEPIQIGESLFEVDDQSRICGVIDEVSNAGPLGGLYTVLKEMKSEWVFVTACDMPGMTADFLEKLSGCVEDNYDCVVCQDRRGRMHPLCSYYRRSLLPVIERMLDRKDYRMWHLLVHGRCKTVELSEIGIEDAIFENVNTPEKLKQQKVFCICGVKNSGKSTYIERLIQELVSREKKVAVIKHDGHDFEGDRPGTDTYRYHEAGAVGTAIFSSQRYMVNRDAAVDMNGLIRQFPEADIILIEGMKNSEWPKIELVRSGISNQLSCNRKSLIAVVTDTKMAFDEAEVWSFDNVKECVDVLLTYTVDCDIK